MLNACWHHGIDHDDDGIAKDVGFRCSTPAGITESITPLVSVQHLRPSSAQRLLASRNRSPFNNRVVVTVGGRCSTPAGITESITASCVALAAPAVSCAQRLLASRNRSPASTAARSWPADHSAQRLLASRNRSLDRLAIVGRGAEMCSTPAGITESITFWAGSWQSPSFSVLNACWHHGIDHRGWRSGRTAPRSAQRLLASRNRSPSLDGFFDGIHDKCSTPAGITESITSRR